MYTVGRAAELTGVPSGTLRKWEQRYGVVVPQRTAGNYRLYDDEAVRRLVVMRSLVDAGWSAMEAARHVVEDAAAAEAELDRPEPTTSDDRVDELAACARDVDVPRLERALSEAFSGRDLAEVVDEWLLPSLARVGRGWQRGEVSVAGEHLVTAAVIRRLNHTFQSLPAAPGSGSPVPGQPRPGGLGGGDVVVGLARGCRHELGVLSFALVLRSHGVPVTYLGGDLPLEAWIGVVRLLDPVAVVLAAPTVEDLPAVREVSEALLPLTAVLLGGAHQDEVAGPEHLGHRPGAAAVLLAEQLRRPLAP